MKSISFSVEANANLDNLLYNVMNVGCVRYSRGRKGHFTVLPGCALREGCLEEMSLGSGNNLLPALASWPRDDPVDGPFFLGPLE